MVQGYNDFMVIGHFYKTDLFRLKGCYGLTLLIDMNNFVESRYCILQKDDKGVVKGRLHLNYFPFLSKFLKGICLLF